MQFASALLEYLVSGLISFLWIIPLINRVSGTFPMLNEVTISFALACAYVLGVFLDATASLLLDRYRKHRSSHTPYVRTTLILMRAPAAVVRSMEAYAGRDRIARGVLLNALIALAVYLTILSGTARISAATAAALGAAWAWAVWMRLDHLTSQFKEEAIHHLEEIGTPVKTVTGE